MSRKITRMTRLESESTCDLTHDHHEQQQSGELRRRFLRRESQIHTKLNAGLSLETRHCPPV